MSVEIKTYLESQFKYIFDTLYHQSTDFKLLMGISDEKDKNEYIQTMSNNTKSMSNDSKNINVLISFLKEIDILMFDMMNIINRVNITISKNEQGKLPCKFECHKCMANDDPILFCMDECDTCLGKRTAEKEFSIKLAKKEHLKMLYMKNAVSSDICKRKETITFNEGVLIGDRYYLVKLSSDKSDGDDEYIKKCLTENFMKLLTPSTLIKSKIYTVKKSGSGEMELTALMRQQTPSGCISNTTNIFKNKIKSQHGHQKYNRPKSIKNFTKYVNRGYQTNKDKIIKYWNEIYDAELSMGDPIENFLT